MESVSILGAVKKTTEPKLEYGRKQYTQCSRVLLDRVHDTPTLKEETEIVDLPPLVI